MFGGAGCASKTALLLTRPSAAPHAGGVSWLGCSRCVFTQNFCWSSCDCHKPRLGLSRPASRSVQSSAGPQSCMSPVSELLCHFLTVCLAAGGVEQHSWCVWRMFSPLKAPPCLFALLTPQEQSRQVAFAAVSDCAGSLCNERAWKGVGYFV